MYILPTLAAYHSCRACITCTLLLEHHPSVHRGSGSDVDWVSHAILGNEMQMHVYMHIAFVLHFWLHQWFAVSVISCTGYRALHLDCRACTICMYTLHIPSLHPLYITGRLFVGVFGHCWKIGDSQPELGESQWHRPPQSYPAAFIFNSIHSNSFHSLILDRFFLHSFLFPSPFNTCV